MTQQIHSITEARALALLGDSPRVTLVDPNDPATCLSVRLARAGTVWVGLVDDGSAVLDRIRMGMRPHFVMHPDAATSTVAGDLDVRILGRAEEVPDLARRFGEQPFGLARAVVIEVLPRGLELEPLEASGALAKGAVPQT